VLSFVSTEAECRRSRSTEMASPYGKERKRQSPNELSHLNEIE
jgi:hypothetical protein